ncbi:hypothetical protein BJF79_31395 [Actinomadura sp. CNU-125]|uniref:hypothetical protein n=1 Tax=Actinomadura sp. CNU-125 TaxID=1904961 RepID=UPI00095B4320|nr:hypothetical protein [Actinomadura sp. CNU-125]OLT36337.1 hypothetical protein BJF79_31395 [Actinomadura sp. CNU-125]
MVGEPPSVWFIGVMLVPGICWLATKLLVEDGSYTYLLGLGTFLAVLAILVRMVLTFWPRMLGAPPGGCFIGAVAAAGGCLLACDWFLSVDVGVVVTVVAAAFVAVVGVIGRTALAFWLPRRDAKAFAVRTSAPAVLTAAVMFVLLAHPPGEVRMELSRRSLNEFARTVDGTGTCGQDPKPRWVGLYKVDCVYRDGNVVHLAVDEPFVPTHGRTWLIGPGNWNTWIQD